MNLETTSLEELREMSLIDLAYEIFLAKKEAIVFKDLLAEMTDKLELTDEEVRTRISQFYTDLNIDGRFLCLGDNKWGLRAWYPFNQFEDESLSLSTPKPKKKKSKKDEEDDFDDFDEVAEDDFDDIEDFVSDDDEDEDDTDDELDGFIEEDELDADLDEEVELDEEIEGEELEIEAEEDELVEEEE